MPTHSFPWDGAHRVLYALVLILFTCSEAGAQEQLSLDKALHEAIQFNPQLRAARFEAGASQADLATAGLRPNPTLTVNADILPSNGLGPADKNYGLSVNFPFELGGKRDARIHAAQASVASVELEFRDQLRQTIGAVRNAYFDFLGSAEKARVAEESLTLLDSLVSLSRARVAGKDIAVVELTRSEVEREKFALDVVRAREEHRAAMTSLLALMGRSPGQLHTGIQPDSSMLTIVRQTATVDLIPLDSLIAIAERERTDLQALRAQEAAAAANLELQRSLAKIDLNVSLDLMRSQGVTFYGSTVSVPLPIYNQNQGEIAKAEIRLDQSKAITDAALAQLRADVTNAWFDTETKQRSLKTLETSVLQKAFDVRSAIEYSYKRGGTSLIDYLDAARTYNELELAYVDALQSYAKSLVTLNLTTGKDLFYAHS